MKKRIIVIEAALAISIFSVDIHIPLGVAGGIPYVAVVLASLWSRQKVFILSTAIFCSLLIALGFFLSPPGSEMWKVIVNRSLAIGSIWITALLLIFRLRSEIELERINKELDSRVVEATLQLQKVNETLRQELFARKRINEELQESEERFHQISDHCEDILWLSSLDRRRLFYVSAAFEKIWGFPRKDIYSNPKLFFDSIHPDDKERVLLELNSNVAGEFARKYRVVRPDGMIRWVWSRGFPIRNGQGKVYRMAGIISDISEWVETKKREADHQIKLMHADRLTTVGRLAAGVAHEINNPLTALYGMVQDVNESPEYCTQKVSTAMLRVCRRIKKTVENLLMFSRQLKPKKSLIEISNVIQDSLHLISSPLRKQGIDLKLKIDNEIPLMKVDASQLQQVFANLIFNAIDAMPKGGILTILMRRSNGKVIISFQDTGFGIDPQHLDKIFLPFFSTKEIGKGTGLGLSISHGIIQEHGGEINVSSTSNQGSIFEVSLPLASDY